MPRPPKDGGPARPVRKLKLTDLYLDRLRADPERSFLTWDSGAPHLAIKVEPTNKRSWKFAYRHHGRLRWYHIGSASALPLAEARKEARRLTVLVDQGKDPQAEKAALRSRGTFEELAARYVEEHARRKNKSWQQADRLVRTYLLPRWGKLMAADITRSDVHSLAARISAPILANQVLASASAIFSWAVRREIVAANPVTKVDRNETRDRERVLSESELPRFWAAFDSVGLVEDAALRMILLTAQRPGEVSHMRAEHVRDGWWEMPGEPDEGLGWPGVKNGEDHKVWLSEPATAILAELTDGRRTGLVFAGNRSRPVDLARAMRAICADLDIDNKVTPHDLRRTSATIIQSLGLSLDVLDKVMNHKDPGKRIRRVYNQYQYEQENRHMMEALAGRILALAEGRTAPSNVVQMSA
jgi:integrase